MPVRLEAHRIRRFVGAEHARSLAAAVYRVKTSESRGRVRITTDCGTDEGEGASKVRDVQATVS